MPKAKKEKEPAKLKAAQDRAAFARKIRDERREESRKETAGLKQRCFVAVQQERAATREKTFADFWGAPKPSKPPTAT